MESIKEQTSTLNEAPAVRLVEEMIDQAIARGASDIHLEPHEQGLRVRYRVDGILLDQQPLPLDYALQIISRIKVLANLDIAEKRIPQDGKFILNHANGTIDLRVATFPARHGEKMVIRILDRFQQPYKLSELGFEPLMLKRFNYLLQRSSGFLLVTGPTGSGKTTTLYAMLSALNRPEKNIVTLEDPIEYTIAGITQGHINADIGFSFDRGLRALVRQDPDIIMVGEIRDRETADVAIHAALTGHLVLSTLHTNDSVGAVMRLIDMGIQPFLINAAVTGVVAQRLARKLCQSCKHEITMTPEMLNITEQYNLAIEHVFEAAGCEQCNNLGFKGRIGIFELLIMSHRLRASISHYPEFDEMYAQALEDGLCPLICDAAQKVNQGVISFKELLRVCL